jgi:hypothetical protein
VLSFCHLLLVIEETDTIADHNIQVTASREFPDCIIDVDWFEDIGRLLLKLESKTEQMCSTHERSISED